MADAKPPAEKRSKVSFFSRKPKQPKPDPDDNTAQEADDAPVKPASRSQSKDSKKSLTKKDNKPSPNAANNNDAPPSVNKKQQNAAAKKGKESDKKDKSWFSWSASKKVPTPDEPDDTDAESAINKLHVGGGNNNNNAFVQRNTTQEKHHALSRVATAKTNRQLSLASNKSVRWSNEDLQQRGAPPFNVEQNLQIESPRGRVQNECEQILEKLIESARYQREIQERNAVIEILKEQRDCVQAAIVETNDSFDTLMKEQDMLAVRMGHYYSQLAKERLRERIVAIYEDYERVAALKLTQATNERSSLTSLSDSLAQAGFGERIHNDMLTITKVLANNDLSLETEMAKLDNDWQEHHEMNKELNGRVNVLQRANLEVNEKILAVKQSYSLQAKHADELKRREINTERQKHDILREALRVKEAERERRYDSLMALLDRIIAGATHRHKLALKKTHEFHRQWDEDMLKKVLANDKKFDDTTLSQKYSSEFNSFWKFLSGLNMRLLNEKRIYIEFEVDRLQWQADQEIDKKRHFTRMRNVFIEHQQHRYLEEDDADSVYLLTPIELTVHESISQNGSGDGGENGPEFEIQTLDDEEASKENGAGGGKQKREKRLKIIPRRRKKRNVNRDVDVQSTFA